MKRNSSYFLITVLIFIFIGLIPLYPYFIPLNNTVRSFIGATLFHPFYYIAIILHNFFETFLSTVQTIIWAAVILLVLKDGRGSILLIAAMAFEAIVANTTKLIAMVPRPPQEYFGILHHTYAYPSGHTATSLTMAIMLTYVLCRRNDWKYGRVISAAYIVLAILTPYSRLYLDVHWIMDLVGGWCVGGFISLMVMTYDRYFLKSGASKRTRTYTFTVKPQK